MVKSRFLPFLLLLLASAVHLGAEQVRLVHNGHPSATIVLQNDANVRLTQAAEDLQTYIAKLSGVELPLTRDGKRVAGTGLYVGQCEPSLPGDMPDRELNPETYAIRVRDGNVYFAGRHPSPAAFAVCSFIEDTLGVRWFAPGEVWEFVPEGTAGELTVDADEVVRTPDTSPRIWSGHAWFDSWKRWNLRNRTVLSEVVPRRQFQNYLHYVFPPEKYGETNAEFYPLVDGKRWIPKPGDRSWRPCESNPEVIRLTVEYARKWFDDHPSIDSFSVGMDDISHLCACANCRALDPRPDSYESREFADRHYKFVNTIAREIAKTHPDRYIGTLIYDIARELPETVARLEDNVFGFMTETSALWWRDGRKAADHELTRQWAKRCKHLSRYDYFGMGTFCPRFYPHTVAEQLKFDKALGLEGMYTEVYTFLPHTAPMIWAFAKLQWDASLDIDRLLNDFYTKMFGEAAGTMAQYFDLLERSWNTPRPGRERWVHRNVLAQVQSISPEDCDRGMALLGKALGEAEDQFVGRRIDTIRAALQYAGYAVKAHGLSRRLATAPLTNERETQAALDALDELMRLGSEREKFWPEAMERDDLLGENLRGLGGMGYLVTGQVSKLEHAALIAGLETLNWYRENRPDELAGVRERFTRSTPGGNLRNAIRACVWVQEDEPPNLALNPGFEDCGPNETEPEKDWETKGAPKGWSLWSRAGNSEFKVQSGAGRNGTAAAVIIGGSGGTYLQTIQATPGERYLCTCWARCAAPAGQVFGRFSVRFRKPDGSWHERHDLEPQVDLVESASWHPLILFVTIPEGAGSFILMPGCGSLGSDGSVAFDEVAAYRLPREPDAASDALRQLRDERARAAARQRRIIFNNDGDDHILSAPFSIDAFLAKRTTPLLGSQVDAIFYCTSRPFGMFTHNTAVGDVFAAKTGFSGAGGNIVSDLIEHGTDTLRTMIGLCREHDLEIFWSMRMNDTHDTSHRPDKPHHYFSTFKKEHPEYLLGTRGKRPVHGGWTAVDFAQPVVRDFAFRVFQEICRNYDVDGIELDFFRHLVFFRTVAGGGLATAEERDMMTDLLRRTREMTEAEGLRRGRPLLVAVRAPDSVDFCRGMGLDIENWMADGLLDLFIAGGDFRLNPWEQSTRPGKKHGVPVYCDLDPFVLHGLRSPFGRNSIQTYRGRAMNAWSAGAAGIYIFNCFNPRHQLWRELGSPDLLRRSDKLYFADAMGKSGYLKADGVLPDGGKHRSLPLLNPQTPMRLSPGQPVEVPLRVGEDLTAAASLGLSVEATCHVLSSVDAPPELKLNGEPLTARPQAAHWCQYRVRPEQLRVGLNRVEIMAPAGDSSATQWDVEYKCVERPPVPWICDRPGTGTSATIQDGALLIADRSAEPGSYLYHSFPWNVDPAIRSVLEVRAKVVSGRSTIIVCNGVAEEQVRLYPDRVVAQYAGLTHSLDTTDAFHVYRIEIEGEDIEVLVDGAPALDGTGRFTRPAHAGRNLIFFGASTSPTTGEAYWESLRFRSGTQSLYDLVLSVRYGE